MNSEYKIIVEHLSKAYKMYNKPTDRLKEAIGLSSKQLHTDFYALSDISFSVKSGEILGIIGRNGSGKSTLLKIVTGVLTPTDGIVNVRGKISSLLELGTGFNHEYTGIENVYFYGTLMGMSRSQMDMRLNEIRSFAEIGDYIYQPVKTYSSGMFARLAFSCAINVEPEVLLVDEILSVGDMRFQAKCFNKFKEFKEQGVTIIYVGHDISTMRTFCDTCMWLNNGKVVDIGEPVYISSKYTEFMYLDEKESLTAYKMIPDKLETSDNGEDDQAELSNHSLIIDERLKQNNFANAQSLGTPLAHWGGLVGTIKNVRLTDTMVKDIDYFAPGDEVIVSLEIPHRTELDYECLSVAFSIKNKEGTDLIVRTTYDMDIRFEPGRDYKVEFRVISMLSKGEYYLVVALENRRNASIMYYEYIEGAAYFKIYDDREIFGVFLPEVKIDINTNDDKG